MRNLISLSLQGRSTNARDTGERSRPWPTSLARIPCRFSTMVGEVEVYLSVNSHVDDRRICIKRAIRAQRPHADACRGRSKALQERIDVDVG